MSSAVESVLERMRPAWDASPTLVVLTSGPEHTVVFQNPASCRLFGPRRLGVPIGESFPEMSTTGRSTLDDVMSTARAVEQRTPRPGVLGASGDEVLLTYVFAPVGKPGRAPGGVLLTAVDVTAEVTAARAAEQSALLSDMSERMNAAAASAQALQEMTRTLVPAVADLAAVYVLPGTGAEYGLGGAEKRERGARPTALSISDGLIDEVGMPPESDPSGEPSPWDEPLAKGQALLIDIEAGEIDQQSDDAARAWMRKARAHNMAVLPLALAGQLVGAVVLLSTQDRAPYRTEDLPFLELVAARAGAAVSHLRAFRQQRQIALDLQHALLPPVPSPVSGLQVAARYIAGGEDVEIGGDWWDVLEVRPGVAGIGLGDVSGRGIPAAVVMGQARAAMRAAALAGLSPAQVLELLDRQLLDLFDAPIGAPGPVLPRFATAVYAVIDTGPCTLTMANAGHPPLVLRLPDGRVERVSAPAGPPIGLGLPQYEEMVIPFPVGSMLVGCTDGLIETRSATLGVGIERLEQFVAQLDSDADIDIVVDEALAWMSIDGQGDDDIALVVVRSAPDAA